MPEKLVKGRDTCTVCGGGKKKEDKRTHCASTEHRAEDRCGAMLGS